MRAVPVSAARGDRDDEEHEDGEAEFVHLAVMGGRGRK
jgi:hypothetical protein